jgi:hypothetical protein
MFSDPLAVTYNSSAKSLPRVSAGPSGTVYRTADGEFEVSISNHSVARDGSQVSIQLARRLPDPTPSNVFDDYRSIKNSFTLSYGFDLLTKAEASVDIPLLRSALLSFVDTTLQGRLIAGEK